MGVRLSVCCDAPGWGQTGRCGPTALAFTHSLTTQNLTRIANAMAAAAQARQTLQSELTGRSCAAAPPQPLATSWSQLGVARLEDSVMLRPLQEAQQLPTKPQSRFPALQAKLSRRQR